MQQLSSEAKHTISQDASFAELAAPDRNKLINDYLMENRVAIVGGVRTPFVKAKGGGAFKNYDMLDMSKHVVNGLVQRLNLDPKKIDELIYGTVLIDPAYPNLAREIVLRSNDLPKHINAHFVSNNCITGLVAINKLAEDISLGRVSVGIAGGIEKMSSPALMMKPEAQRLWLKVGQSNGLGERLANLSKWRPRFALPQEPSPKEPSTGLTMGEHCELMVKEFGIARKVQDEIALASHRNAEWAQKKGYLAEEILPYHGVTADNLIRPDTSFDVLTKLKPSFDKRSGTITAGNSSQLTDGASAVCLMSEAEALAQGREILGFLTGVEFAAINPEDGLLMAPGLALPRMLKRHGMKMSDLDRIEVHEAFAAQVEANNIVWRDGWAKYGIEPIGEAPADRMNVNGGSIAIGHPFAATGARLLHSLANELKRSGGKQGALSVCAAGGMACAMKVERE